MGLLHQKEGMEKATNKCGRRVLQGVHHCPNFNCKSSTVSAVKKRWKSSLYNFLGPLQNGHITNCRSLTKNTLLSTNSHVYYDTTKFRNSGLK